MAELATCSAAVTTSSMVGDGFEGACDCESEGSLMCAEQSLITLDRSDGSSDTGRKLGWNCGEVTVEAILVTPSAPSAACSDEVRMPGVDASAGSVARDNRLAPCAAPAL